MGHQMDSLDRSMLLDKAVNRNGGRKIQVFNFAKDDWPAWSSRRILGEAQTNPTTQMDKTLAIGIATALRRMYGSDIFTGYQLISALKRF